MDIGHMDISYKPYLCPLIWLFEIQDACVSMFKILHEHSLLQNIKYFDLVNVYMLH